MSLEEDKKNNFYYTGEKKGLIIQTSKPSREVIHNLMNIEMSKAFPIIKFIIGVFAKPFIDAKFINTYIELANYIYIDFGSGFYFSCANTIKNFYPDFPFTKDCSGHIPTSSYYEPIFNELFNND